MASKGECGFGVINDPGRNKATAFSRVEREKLGLRGLFPHKICSMEMQVERALANLRRKAYDIERYVFLVGLMERNERLFYRTVIENIEEIMPLIYTPTVGQACKEFAHIFRKTRGFYITPDDRGSIRSMLDNWPEEDVRVVVVTDGQRILGLGDLGANGMGIPIGKLSLYSACAGIYPHHCLPVMLDVGTDNQELLDDPLYLGYPDVRLKGDEYLSLVDEFVDAINDKFAGVLIQFEDFLTPNAYSLLERYRERVLCFNDDIQGTAAVALAGVYTYTKISEVPFPELRIMFLGAGSAATGIADLMVLAFKEAGLDSDEARRRLWFCDIDGLVEDSRADLMPHNIPYAHKYGSMGFIDAIQSIKPHVLIGATGAPGTFTKDVIETMSDINRRPGIFALSNPTSNAECSAEQAYAWSKGRAIFSSGSPFAPVEYEDNTFIPGQGNNAYIFPAIGLGVTAVKAHRVSENMFLVAAHSLAEQVSSRQLAAGTLYPPLVKIREVSKRIAIAVAKQAFKEGLACIEEPDDLDKYIEARMYQATYRSERACKI